jgi:hypothetical protein
MVAVTVGVALAALIVALWLIAPDWIRSLLPR